MIGSKLFMGHKKLKLSFNNKKVLIFRKIKRYAIEIQKNWNFGLGKYDPPPRRNRLIHSLEIGRGVCPLVFRFAWGGYCYIMGEVIVLLALMKRYMWASIGCKLGRIDVRAEGLFIYVESFKPERLSFNFPVVKYDILFVNPPISRRCPDPLLSHFWTCWRHQ